MKKNRTTFIVVVVVMVLFISFLIWRSGERNTQTVFTFACASKKTVDAVFTPDTVTLKLSDNRTLVLKQVVSASGARYTNLDGSVVFWNKGESAYVEENGVASYTDCMVKP